MLSRRVADVIHAPRIYCSPRSYYISVSTPKPSSASPHVISLNRLAPIRFIRKSSTRTTVRAGLSSYSTLAAVGLAIVASLVAYRWTVADHSIEKPNQENPLQRLDTIQDSPYYIAIGSMPPPPGPGRPGNLTSEQEAKLREFWVALLGVFGVHGDHTVSDSVGTPTHDDHPADVERKDTMGSEKDKKKKKHLGLFGKSRKDKDSSASSSAVDETVAHSPSSAAAANDANDKYGQTKQFKDALASMTPEELRMTFWSMVKHDNPDALLLRFLRARKWDVEKALVMLVSTVHWRAHEAHVDDDVIRVGELGAVEAAKSAENPASKKEAEDFLTQLRMGKSYLHGVDKEGRPMCIVRVRLHKQGEQSEASLERYTVYVIETARFLLQAPVDTAVCLSPLSLSLSSELNGD